MGNVHPLPKTADSYEAPPFAAADGTITRIELKCALCGAKLNGRALRHHLIPPQAARKIITVCHTCNKAALGEGYRPAV
jgi:hypothetical protein